MKIKNNPTLLVLTTIFVATGAYWYFFTGTAEDPSLTALYSENQAQMRFKTLLGELPISFNTNIFSEPRFRALVDLTTPITPEEAGRLDPFAPVPGISGN